jgi:hypothetical protein
LENSGVKRLTQRMIVVSPEGLPAGRVPATGAFGHHFNEVSKAELVTPGSPCGAADTSIPARHQIAIHEGRSV